MARRKPKPRTYAVGTVANGTNANTLLTTDREKALVDATRMGVPVATAAAAAGIGHRTFQDWMQRGRLEEEHREEGGAPNGVEQRYLDLWLKVVQARAVAASRSVLQIQKSAQGGIVTEETVRKFRDPDTGALIEETSVKRTAPDWRAAAWYLERQHAQHFGKEALQVELTGAGGGAVQVGVNAEDLAAKLTANIKALTAATSAAAALEAGNITDAELVEEPVDADVVDDNE